MKVKKYIILKSELQNLARILLNLQERCQETKLPKRIIPQLVAAGTAVGSNYCEADPSNLSFRADEVNKGCQTFLLILENFASKIAR